jgi:hypothetical protein
MDTSDSSGQREDGEDEATDYGPFAADFVDRVRQEGQGSILPTLAKPVAGRSAIGMQLLSKFIDIHMPAQRSSMRAYFSYTSGLPGLDLSNPLIASAVDTICLAEIGQLYEDERMLRASSMSYVRALPLLANELARSEEKKQVRKDHLLGTILLLTLSETFDSVARAGGGWLAHANGAEAYLQAYGRQAIATDVGIIFFHTIRHICLFKGLVKRKAVVLAQPQWLRFAREEAKTDPFVALYNLALQIPGILERADSLPQTTEFLLDFRSLCKDAAIIRAELHAWHDRFYAQHRPHARNIAYGSCLETFNDLCEDRTFQTFYLFDSVESCSQHLVYYASCLLLDHTLLDVYSAHRHRTYLPPLGKFFASTKENIQRELYVSATSFCRSVPYCCDADVASLGRVASFLLRPVQRYFDEYGYTRELEWTAAARSVLEIDGRTPGSRSQGVTRRSSPSSSRPQTGPSTATTASVPSSSTPSSDAVSGSTSSPQSTSATSSWSPKGSISSDGGARQAKAKGMVETFDASAVALVRSPVIAKSSASNKARAAGSERKGKSKRIGASAHTRDASTASSNVLRNVPRKPG